jgi:hypothetical protein
MKHPITAQRAIKTNIHGSLTPGLSLLFHYETWTAIFSP